MNHCYTDRITTEKCECAKPSKSSSPEIPVKICEIGSMCTCTADSCQCVEECVSGRTGPCACRNYPDKDLDLSANFAGANEKCVATEGGSQHVYYAAQVGEYYTHVSACPNKVLNPDSAFYCIYDAYCLSENGVDVVCAMECRKNSSVVQDCLCIGPGGPGGVNKRAAKGQYCSENGDVSELPSSECAPNSIVVSNCTCPGASSQCAIDSYCVGGDLTTQKCYQACVGNKFNAVPSGCACNVGNTAKLAVKDQACVEHKNVANLYSIENACQPGQVGPCACPNTPAAPGTQAAEYTDENSACVYYSESKQNLVAHPLAAYNTPLQVVSACTQDVKARGDAVRCFSGQYCLKISDDNALCVPKCTAGQTATKACACIAKDTGKAAYALQNQFCGLDGVVTDLEQGKCADNSISAGGCKCSAADAEACNLNSYCLGATPEPQKCYEQCVANRFCTLDACACPYEGVTAPIGRDAACLKFDNSVIAVYNECKVNQVGPCACRNSNSASAEYAPENFVCTKTNIGQYAFPICKVDFISRYECACQIVADYPEDAAVQTYVQDVCVTQNPKKRANLKLCQSNAPTEKDCACRIKNAQTAVLYCPAGHSCMEDPRDPKASVCIVPCAADNTCQGGATCMGQEENLPRCLTACAANAVIESPAGCACDGKICGRGSACVNGACVQNICTVGTVNSQPCYCWTDGTATINSVTLAPTTAVCMETDHATRQYGAVVICTAEQTDNCACLHVDQKTAFLCDKSEKCVNDGAKNVCLPVCQADMPLTAACACGPTSCQEPRICFGARVCGFVCIEHCRSCPDAADACVQCESGFALKKGQCKQETSKTTIIIIAAVTTVVVVAIAVGVAVFYYAKKRFARKTRPVAVKRDSVLMNQMNVVTL